MDQNSDKLLNLRIGITIYPSQKKAIKQVLGELEERCPTQLILLADVSGLLISIRGNRGESDPIALASLIAGDLAASQEIARMTNQYQSCQLILREGQKTNSFIAEVGPYLALFIQVDAETPLGWARLLILEASRQIVEIVSARPQFVQKPELELDEVKILNAVDNTFDNLWTK
jgi:predicted regulator of Ras-like GTPase activity (Roadblock/LC7/MglB family)